MRNVLITGASSFLGAGIAATYAAAGGHGITGVVRSKYRETGFRQSALYDHVVYLDMVEYRRFSALDLPPVDTAIFLAWDGTRGKDRSDFDKQEFSYRRTLDAFHGLFSRGCRKFILAGSQAEYDVRDNPAKIAESFQGDPQTAYGIVKLRLYQNLRELCLRNGCTLIEPRFFSVYGVGDFEGTLIMQTIRKMLLLQDCRFTACNQLWNYTYIDDAAKAVYLLDQNPHADGVYNVGTHDTRKLRDFILEIKNITGFPNDVCFSSDAFQKKGEVYANPDITRICDEIGWQPIVSFREGIGRIVKNESFVEGM